MLEVLKVWLKFVTKSQIQNELKKILKFVIKSSRELSDVPTSAYCESVLKEQQHIKK